jgi:hypothetical protein
MTSGVPFAFSVPTVAQGPATQGRLAIIVVEQSFGYGVRSGTSVASYALLTPAQVWGASIGGTLAAGFRFAGQ